MIIAAPRIINTAEQTGEQLDILFPFFYASHNKCPMAPSPN
jgi:hypothetical protein